MVRCAQWWHRENTTGSQERPGKGGVPGQLVLSLQEEMLTVCSHHLTTDIMSLCGSGALCSHPTIPPTAGEEPLASLAMDRMQMKGNLTRLCLRQASSALFP